MQNATSDGLRRADADALSRGLGTKLKQSRELHDARRQAIAREPALVNHLGEPTSEDNAVAVIDRELQKVGDLQDLAQRRDHAQRLEESAKQSWADFVAANFWQLIDAHRPEAQAVTDSANQAAAVLAEELRRYLAAAQALLLARVPVHGKVSRLPGPG